MTWKTLVLVCITGTVAHAQGILIDHTCVDESDSKIPQKYLDSARELDILFGHQSVGANILDGLHALAEGAPDRYAFEHVLDPQADWYESNDGIGDFGVGENENPQSKIEHFQRKLSEEGYGDRVSVAMIKLCYIDFSEDEKQAQEVFEVYRSTMESLEKSHPKVKFVWWTAPLMTENNRARHSFNNRVRSHCKSNKKTLFDIADIESHGRVGKDAKNLCPEYAEDEGHLSELGRSKVARGWWWMLARIQGWDGK